MGITKNIQSNEVITKMMNKALPEKQVLKIKELTEGMFNIAYNVSFTDGSEGILKIAPKDKEGLMSNEINLMDAEVKAMQIMKQYNFVKVADIYCYDKSKQICSSDYLLMEKLSGQNYMFLKDKMSKEDRDVISFEIGQIQRRMHEITGEQFGLLGDDKRFDSLYDFFCMMLLNSLKDVQSKQVDIGVTSKAIKDALQADRGIFEEVKKPSFVHWDMWEGNIFVEKGHVCGIIDWERAMWGDPFMDDRFRQHSRDQEFLKGYGKEELTDTEQRRICWYDIFLYISMIVEVTFRQYEDDGQIKWVTPLLEKALKKIGLK